MLFCYSKAVRSNHLIQVIPGNDQNTSPTNQKTAGSKLERTSQLMFNGCRRHLKSFSGNFLVLIFFTGTPSHIPGEKSGIKRSTI